MAENVTPLRHFNTIYNTILCIAVCVLATGYNKHHYDMMMRALL